jgi:tetratricopeptide (TPR) repeat protein
LFAFKLNSRSGMNRKRRIINLAAAIFFRLSRAKRRFGFGAILGTAAVLILAQGQIASNAAQEETNAAPNIASSETNALAAAASSDTNAQETLRTYLQLQEQLHLTQLAVEQNRREARDTAAQNSDVLASRLQSIERALESQRTRELEAMQSSNRAMLWVAGTFAAVGFLAMMLMSFFQWRTVDHLAEISAGLPASLGFGSAQARAALGAGDTHALTVGPAEQSSMRLVGSMEQLEKRIYQLEHTTHTPLHEANAANGGKNPSHGTTENGEPGLAVSSDSGFDQGIAAEEAERVSVLLGKGQSMLNLDDAQAAAECFEQALRIDPNNAEAWVRKGTALERLQQLNEAVECYDRAIASDGSLTIAYLHKGGLFNRMERYNEALECYEKALRTQEKRRAS